MSQAEKATIYWNGRSTRFYEVQKGRAKRWKSTKRTSKRCVGRLLQGQKRTAPGNEPEAGYHPSRGHGSASNRGGGGAKQPSVDHNASNEDLLRAALLQVLGGNQKGGAPKVKEAASLKFPELPRPENHRKWKTAIREEIRASSDKPDEAWEWLMEVYQDREDT